MNNIILYKHRNYFLMAGSITVLFYALFSTYQDFYASLNSKVNTNFTIYNEPIEVGETMQFNNYVVVVSPKEKKIRNYIKRFGKIAIAEKNKFGIPASIILAQGILESDCGNSRLAKNANNHFGMKCFSKSCKKGHCMNFSDDSHKDFFKIFKTPWESYRAHSLLIKNKHYRVLFKYGDTDYKHWAFGLKGLGYATDKYYAESLITLIEENKLYNFDKF